MLKKYLLNVTEAGHQCYDKHRKKNATCNITIIISFKACQHRLWSQINAMNRTCSDVHFRKMLIPSSGELNA